MTARLRLIRHGHAAGSVGQNQGEDQDPGLSLFGAKQVMALPQLLGDDRRQRLIVSPLRRARETALPLSVAFGLEREIDMAYGELPWREGETVLRRAQSLKRELAGSWADLDAARRHWRDALVRRALSETGDLVIVSHFVAINALIGVALRDDRMVVARLQNASVTELLVEGQELKLVRLGQEDQALLRR